MGSASAEVLLVEDEPDDADLLVRELCRRRPGTRVQVVYDGVEALRRLLGDDDAQPPKLVVLDLRLPKLDGMEVLRCMSAHRTTARIPVVVLSGTCSPEDVGASRSYGAIACMRKPHGGGDVDRILDVLTGQLH